MSPSDCGTSSNYIGSANGTSHIMGWKAKAIFGRGGRGDCERERLLERQYYSFCYWPASVPTPAGKFGKNPLFHTPIVKCKNSHAYKTLYKLPDRGSLPDHGRGARDLGKQYRLLTRKPPKFAMKPFNYSVFPRSVTSAYVVWLEYIRKIGNHTSRGNIYFGL